MEHSLPFAQQKKYFSILESILKVCNITKREGTKNERKNERKKNERKNERKKMKEKMKEKK
jgi:hypothetical protein